MLFKEAEVIVEGKCAQSVWKDQFSLNKLQSDEEEKLLLMSFALPLVMSLSSLEVFSAPLGHTVLTLASSFFCCVCILHNSCSYRNTNSCILKNELMEGVPAPAATYCSTISVTDCRPMFLL